MKKTSAKKLYSDGHFNDSSVTRAGKGTATVLVFRKLTESADKEMEMTVESQIMESKGTVHLGLTNMPFQNHRLDTFNC